MNHDNIYSQRLIPNASLSLDLLPAVNADYVSSISPFALTFDGYDYCGSQIECFGLAKKISDAYEKTGVFTEPLSQLRSALFFLQRNVRQWGYGIDCETLRYAHAMVEAIRDRVAAGHIE